MPRPISRRTGVSLTGPRALLLAGLATLVAACSGPETPQEVSRAFWAAAVEEDAGGAARYSTLGDAADYDAFSRNWAGYQPTWGRVVIDGNEASVAAAFAHPRSGEFTVTTYLVRREGAWLVDYDRTGRYLDAGVFGGLFDSLNQLGEELGGELVEEFSRQFNASAAEAEGQLEQMLQELEQAQQELGRQANEAMEDYAEELRDALEAMDESIQRALEENQRTLTPGDRQLLQSASADLKQVQERDGRGTLETIYADSRQLDRAQQKLASLDDESLAEYQQRWQELLQQLAAGAGAVHDRQPPG